MQKITGNEPVTPHLTYNKTSGRADGFVEGLTIRQHFAAMAMQGFYNNGWGVKDFDFELVAQRSVKAADALIAELNKTE